MADRGVPPASSGNRSPMQTKRHLLLTVVACLLGACGSVSGPGRSLDPAPSRYQRLKDCLHEPVALGPVRQCEVSGPCTTQLRRRSPECDAVYQRIDEGSGGGIFVSDAPLENLLAAIWYETSAQALSVNTSGVPYEIHANVRAANQLYLEAIRGLWRSLESVKSQRHALFEAGFGYFRTSGRLAHLPLTATDVASADFHVSADVAVESRDIWWGLSDLASEDSPFFGFQFYVALLLSGANHTSEALTEFESVAGSAGPMHYPAGEVLEIWDVRGGMDMDLENWQRGFCAWATGLLNRSPQSVVRIRYAVKDHVAALVPATCWISSLD